jgi:16S rRNA (cytosine1402-N4)-methyltransferase
VASEYHVPVLIEESLNALITDRNGIYVDATFGGGGHSRAILSRLSGQGQLIAFDQDADALSNTLDDERFKLVHGNFRFLKHYLRYLNIQSVHGILADLGVSSYQLDEGTKGFSFSTSEDLDMRMNKAATKSALDVVNQESEENLVNIFSSYGEVRNSKSLAKAIDSARNRRPISNSHEFLHCVEPLAIGNKARYLAQVYQAIRIKVNDEIGSLEHFLAAGADMLVPGGHLVVLTYHSIEDRIVKHFIKSGKTSSIPAEGPGIINRNVSEDWILKPVNKKPITASPEEIIRNKRSRSAKLRIARKTSPHEQRSSTD